MSTTPPEKGKWSERGTSQEAPSTGAFASFFERSVDAIWLLDPERGVFVDCNQAAVDLMRGGTRDKLLQARPEDLSPPLQPDGMTSQAKAALLIQEVLKHGSLRFEWVARRFDGQEAPLEVLCTA